MTHMLVVDDVIVVSRCTEAFDEKTGALEVIGNPTGRCVQIIAVTGGSLLLDRRMARRLAAALLEVAGPDEELPTDDERPQRLVCDERGVPVSFEPII